MKNGLFIILFIYSYTISFAQQDTIKLWPKGKIPNSVKSEVEEKWIDIDDIYWKEVLDPWVEVFKPAKRFNTGKAVLICPGGGYRHISFHPAGIDMAKWYNSIGVTAFVLKYRLPHSKAVKVSYTAPLIDAQRAMRIIKYRAKEFGLDSNQIGVQGSSAGGHLASSLSTLYNKQVYHKIDLIDDISAKPSFTVLLFPVITMDSSFTHLGSRKNLLGELPDQELIEGFSTENHVTAHTSKTILIHSSDDKVVSVKNSLLYYEALINLSVKAEMHIYPYGGHGYALAINKGYLQTWTDRLKDWLFSSD